MIKLNDDFAVKSSKEITIKAMENGLISKCEDSRDTAKEVFNFFEALCDNLTGTPSNEN